MDPYKREIQQIRPSKVASLRPTERKQTVKLVGLIAKQKRMSTKSGRVFVLIELMDDTGTIEMACFDERMQQLQLALTSHEVVVIEGTYQENRRTNQTRFNITQLTSLEQYRQMHGPVLHIKVSEEKSTETTAKEIDTLLRNQEQGQSQVVIWFASAQVMQPLRFADGLKVLINEALVSALLQVRGVVDITTQYARTS
jgi:DNA polymerase III alpha subunit